MDKYIGKNMVKITFIICSINIDKLVLSIHSILPYLSNNTLLIILDGISDKKIKEYNSHEGIKIIVNKKNMGLSYSRNLGMDTAETDYIVFFDDDIELTHNIIMKYQELFAEGYNILGGPLKLPKDYPPLPYWLSSGYAYLFTIHTNNKRIWGANFGFNLKLAKNHNLFFNKKLGRKGKGLESGDDTTFIQDLSNFTNKIKFSEALSINHRFDLNRYLLSYQIKRVFWQGRSEVRRNNIILGIKKEFQRSFYFKKGLYNNMIPTFTSIAFINVFFSGILYEKLLLVVRKFFK